MEKKYFVNPTELAVSAATSLISVILAGTLVFISRPGSAVVFALIALLFGRIAANAGALIRIGPDEVTRQDFGRTTRSLSWSDIREVGVAGCRVLNMGKSSKTGTIYIYFSETPLTDDDRFHMMLKWPPRDKIYLQFDRDRMDFIQVMYGKKVQKYNVGDLKI